MDNYQVAQDAVVQACDAIGALPMEQWRGLVLAFLQGLERRAPSPETWEQVVMNIGLDFKQRAAVGRWPGSSVPHLPTSDD